MGGKAASRQREPVRPLRATGAAGDNRLPPDRNHTFPELGVTRWPAGGQAGIPDGHHRGRRVRQESMATVNRCRAGLPVLSAPEGPGQRACDRQAAGAMAAEDLRCRRDLVAAAARAGRATGYLKLGAARTGAKRPKPARHRSISGARVDVAPVSRSVSMRVSVNPDAPCKARSNLRHSRPVRKEQ